MINMSVGQNYRIHLRRGKIGEILIDMPCTSRRP